MRLVVSSALCAALAAGCASRAVPDPKEAADRYLGAAARGDARAMHGMLTRRGRTELAEPDLARVVASERTELAEQAAVLRRPDARVEARATLAYPDGERASLDLEGGAFRVTSAGTLPGGGRSPEQALDQLRRVLARRSFAGLLHVLAPATRAAVERDLRTLVESLERADTTRVEVTGDVALVPLTGGHHVRLKREEGIWRVEDFD